MASSSALALEIKPAFLSRGFQQRLLPRRPSSLHCNHLLRRSRITASVAPAKCESPASFSSGRGRYGITPQKLDQWMQDSVVEIVRNIGKAPFLMEIEGERMTIEKDEASREIWPSIKKRWEAQRSVPEGVILVEELGVEEKVEGESWGVVIQGRGGDCTACYILNTCRVRSSAGFCTHFCLVRAKCFGEPVWAQLMNVWLQQDRCRG